ncbi:MAG TPA: sporulation integral membrane protein YlbJ, partial [Bacillota bacterium]
MGLASGYPVGAVLTARLRENDEITVTEGERLMSFANTADPLFMAGAVAVGMFGSAPVAGTLMAAHYISAVATGFLLRFYAPHAPISPPPRDRRGNMLGRAYAAMIEARARDGRPFGKLFGDCIRQSIDTLILVGGFIIMFAVVTEILGAVGAMGPAAHLTGTLVALFGVDPATGSALVAGLFEITLGSQLAATSPAPLADRLIVASAVIAWAGLSVHGQVAAIIQGTGMRMTPYIAARFVHAVLAGLVTSLLLGGHVPGITLDLGDWAAAPAIAHVAARQSEGTWAAWVASLSVAARSFTWAVAATAVCAAGTGLVTLVRSGIVVWRIRGR